MTADGALEPIEVKSHKQLQRTDELELAFYWLLLEPLRRREVEQPCGHVILRRDGAPNSVEVEITPRRLREVRRLIKEVRQAREQGVRMRACGCRICSNRELPGQPRDPPCQGPHASARCRSHLCPPPRAGGHRRLAGAAGDRARGRRGPPTAQREIRLCSRGWALAAARRELAKEETRPLQQECLHRGALPGPRSRVQPQANLADRQLPHR